MASGAAPFILSLPTRLSTVAVDKPIYLARFVCSRALGILAGSFSTLVSL